MKRELKLGDRVRVYSGMGVSVGVVVVAADDKGFVCVQDEGEDSGWLAHTKQCRRLKRRERRERREFWIAYRLDKEVLAAFTKEQQALDFGYKNICDGVYHVREVRPKKERAK